MLILMRRPGESILIGDEIVVTVVGFERNRVKVGVKAPRHIPVDREEVAERKARNEPPPPSTHPAQAEASQPSSKSGMLVVMRRPGERILVGSAIVVVVVGFERNRVRLGIIAPRGIPVDREEIADKKKRGIKPPEKKKKPDAEFAVEDFLRLKVATES